MPWTVEAVAKGVYELAPDEDAVQRLRASRQFLQVALQNLREGVEQPPGRPAFPELRMPRLPLRPSAAAVSGVRGGSKAFGAAS